MTHLIDAKLAEWLTALRFYDLHVASCRFWANQICSCGLSQLQAATPATPTVPKVKP